MQVTTVTRVPARPGLAPRMAKVSSGSPGGTFWGPKSRVPLGLDSPPLLPASDTAARAPQFRRQQLEAVVSPALPRSECQSWGPELEQLCSESALSP